MKTGRHKEILKIIVDLEVETQEQLLEALHSRGVKSTQATISRDIRELHLVKEMSPTGAYKYTVSGHKINENNANRLRNIFREGVTSCEAAQNLVVIRTMPGLASAACAAIDGMEIEGFVGSLAGDDTAMLILRDNEKAEEICREIHEILD